MLRRSVEEYGAKIIIISGENEIKLSATRKRKQKIEFEGRRTFFLIDIYVYFILLMDIRFQHGVHRPHSRG